MINSAAPVQEKPVQKPASIIPVKASRFLRLPAQLQAYLLRQRVLPQNDILLPLWKDKSKIWMIYGGPGGGKTSFVIDYLINECLTNKYFKCYFGRKVLTSVRSSIFSALVNRIEELGLSSKFSYSKAPTSTMHIICIENGNRFIPFGCDNPDKLKSADNPTHIFCDEFDQFVFDDFKIILPRLRTLKSETKLIVLFNTEKIVEGHWIRELFFSDIPFNEKLKTFLKGTKNDDQEREVLISIRMLLCNYTDNHFIDRNEYEQVLMIAAGFDEKKYQELAAGELGSVDGRNKFAWAFNRTFVVDIRRQEGKQLMTIDKKLPVWLVFDFNVDPMTCLICQNYRWEWLKVIDELRLENSDLWEALERLDAEYGDYYILATGDATSKNRNVSQRGGKSNRIIIKQQLGLSLSQMRFLPKNPSVKDTRVLINALFKRHKNIWISSKCQFLIDDLENVTVNEKGEIEKTKAENKKRGHLLDNLRYITWIVFGMKWLKQNMKEK